jgi:hypothetical protein
MTALAALAGITATGASAAPAEGYRAYEVKQRYVKKKYRSYRRVYHQPQYWADKLPYGSQAWWQQMDREGRGGRRR